MSFNHDKFSQYGNFHWLASCLPAPSTPTESSHRLPPTESSHRLPLAELPPGLAPAPTKLSSHRLNQPNPGAGAPPALLLCRSTQRFLLLGAGLTVEKTIVHSQLSNQTKLHNVCIVYCCCCLVVRSGFYWRRPNS